MYKTVNEMGDISQSWEGNLLVTAIKVLRKPEQSEEEVLQTLIKRVETVGLPRPAIGGKRDMEAGEYYKELVKIQRRILYAPSIQQSPYYTERLTEVVDLIKELLFDELSKRPGLLIILSYSYTWKMATIGFEQDGAIPGEETVKVMVQHIRYALAYYGYEWVTEMEKSPFYLLYFRDNKK